MNGQFEYRSASWEAGTGETISGYAVVFESRTVLYKDPVSGYEYGEIIDRHALDGADMSDVVLRYNHDGRVLARTRNGSLKLTIDNHGLRVEANMNGSEEARSFLEDVRSGLVDKMSFAFVVGADGEDFDTKTRTRRVKAISRLADVSLVDFPAYDQTEVFARSKALYEGFAEHDRRAFQEAEVRRTFDEIRRGLDNFVSPVCTVDDYDADDERENVKRKMCELREAMAAASPSDIDGAKVLEARFDFLKNELREVEKRRVELSKMIANDAGVVTRTFESGERKHRKENDNKMENAMTGYKGEIRALVESFVEQRAAGNTTTMHRMIPETVLEQYVIENAPGAFLADASISHIAHAGDLRLPIASLQTVNEHPENEEIETSGFTPDTLLISHKEYAFNTGYSNIGIKLSASNLTNIVSDTLMRSMMKKMDAVCMDAVAALEYTDNQNAVKIADDIIAMADLARLAGMLTGDYLDGAKWYCNSSTYFNWLLNLKSDNQLVLDPGKPVDQQAPLGFRIRIDNQIPDNTIYFGNGSRVHLNYADEPSLDFWTDYDHRTEKAGVVAVAGAAAEVGSFVKLHK